MMDAKEWLEENGIDPSSVSEGLIRLLNACNEPKCAAMFAICLMQTDAPNESG
jgi:hypothetical protein